MPRQANIQEALTETFIFSNEQEFDDWFETEACSHACWVKNRTYNSTKTMLEGASEYNSQNYSKTICWKCDHSGQPSTKNTTESSKKRRRTSRKVGCPALFDVYYMLDSSVKVVYKWVHENHDPACVEEARHYPA